MDGTPPPPELSRAFIYRRWGVKDAMALPAGFLPKMNIGLMYYDALTAYQRAASKHVTAKWAEQNQRAFEIVTWVLEQRRNNWGEDGNSTK